MNLSAADYVVTAILLLIPFSIGVYYAWKDAGNQTRYVYLLGGHSMRMLPVSLSIFMTNQSAISLISNPTEVYMNGFMFIIIYISAGIVSVIGSWLMVPLLYPLQLTSMYEYLEMRYESKAVRKLATFSGVLQIFFYMIIVILAPGLVLQAGAGIPFWVSVVVVGVIGVIYTAAGGIKSVIWTDAFQALIVFIGVFLVVISGTIRVGGPHKVYEIARTGGRTTMEEVGVDPRIRHTWWNLILGGGTMYLTTIFHQTSVMRLSSVKSERAAKMAYILNLPILLVYGFLVGVIGIVMYAYFHTLQCDPVKGGILSNPNQIIIFYIIHIFQDYPGLSGLYLATIFSGALSTLSSGINALAANTIEDFLGENFLKDFSEKTITIIAKLLVFFYGTAIVIMTYFAQFLESSIVVMSLSNVGVFGSIALGLILVGCSIPWANKYGAIVGSLVSFAINIWIALGAQLYGSRTPPMPSVTTEGCSALFTNASTIVIAAENTTTSIHTTQMPITPVDPSQTSGFFLYNLSYLWYTPIGVIISALVNIIVSKLTSHLCKPTTDARLIHQMFRRYWQMEIVQTTDGTEETVA